MSEKSIVQEARDIQLAMELITLGARLQMLESETQLSRGRLIKLYKELRGSPPPKGMLPFSTDWFMTWEQNVHASMFCNAWQFLLKTGLCNGVDAVIKAYRLYLEQCPQAEDGPLLALTRAWTLVRFVESGLLHHGSAQIDLTFLFHGLVSMDRFVKFLSCQCFSCSYDGKAIHAFGLIELAQLHNLFFRKKIIDFAIRVMMGRLCAVFTVFRTAAAAAVDDGAQVYFITDPCFTDLISSFT